MATLPPDLALWPNKGPSAKLSALRDLLGDGLARLGGLWSLDLRGGCSLPQWNQRGLGQALRIQDIRMALPPNLVHRQTYLEMVWPDLEAFGAWTSGEDARSLDGTRGVWAKL